MGFNSDKKRPEIDVDSVIFGHRHAGTLNGSFTDHPHPDPLTGEQHAITYDPAQPTVVHHIVVSRRPDWWSVRNPSPSRTARRSTIPP